MRQVKGTIIKRVAIPIKANKTGAYDALLSDKSKQLLAERIVDPVWYPFEPYKECFDALCQVEARNDRRIIIQWGRNLGEDLLKSVYKTSVTTINSTAVISSFVRFHSMIFNFGEVEGKILSGHKAEIIFKDFEPDWNNFYYILAGWVQRFFEICLGKEIKYQIVKNPTPGVVANHIQVSWV
ncbi:MAG: hypothetical protein RBG13Loki_3176 [Promethearchaeota archaeon CR_4]|nr:MAG: hypothetical protein RBG13Loki_3176 [Candidatus Lokiarchaeota archaeon CR_4]